MIAAFCFEPLPLYLARRTDPALGRVPVVHVEEQRVLYANPAARRHGVSPGMRLDGARMRIEGLQVVSYSEPDLQHAWHSIVRELYQHTPWLESSARGRVFATLTPDEAAELAALYDVSVGLAESCEEAELAALATRPGTCKRVDDEGAAFLQRLPLRFLRGVGVSEGNLTRLRWLGIVTVGQLAAWTAAQIRSYLGAESERLLPYLHGPRRTSLLPLPLPEALSRTLTFTEPVREPHQLLPALDRLSGELAGALAGRAARRLTLTATLPSGQRRASRLSKRPLTQARHIRQQALFALHDSRAQGHDIERLTLELATPERLGSQEGLWPQRERRQRALDATAERFPGAPRRLTAQDPYAQAGDLAWRWESHADEHHSASDDAAVKASPLARRRAAQAAAMRAAAQEAALRIAGAVTAVPLFSADELSAPSAPTPDISISDRDLSSAPPRRQPDEAPGRYPDLLFMPDPRPHQRFTEPFAPEDDHAPAHDTRPRDARTPRAELGELVTAPA
jgi:nucleotidyltransferase/DNA polymerase involved in DNA repair